MMTREAKIGMLTGLGVIVLIGVLLSQYLGDRDTGPTAAAEATGRMAPLAVGSEYREQVLSPVAVPAMTPAGGGTRTRLAGGMEIASGLGASDGGVPPTLLAAETAAPAGPSVTGPVAPIAAGPTLMDGRWEGGPPLITLADMTVPVKATGAVGAAGAAAAAKAAAKPGAATYTIAAGDTLAKIAKKFYNSAKNSDVQRIVAANPGMLKDAGTMLVVNKKLVIPNVPAPAATPPAAAPIVPAAATGVSPMTPPMAADSEKVYLPTGAVTTPVPGLIAPPKKDAVAAKGAPVAKDATSAKDATTAKKPGTYVVQAGDTLEKIARKLTPAKTAETVQKLISLNGLKDPNSLKVGQTLKMPA